MAMPGLRLSDEERDWIVMEREFARRNREDWVCKQLRCLYMLSY